MEEPKAKTVIVGEAGVGKTCIAKRKFQGKFDEASVATMGSEFIEGVEETENGKFRFEVWDTAGQESYRCLVPMFFKDAVIAIFVYDITKKSTLNVLWEYKQKIDDVIPTCRIALVGNKCDLTDQREVEREEGMKLKEELGAVLFMETSAKTGEGLDDLFYALAREPTLHFRNSGLKLKPSEPNKKKCNC